MKSPPLKRDDLVYPELSYKLVGYAYEVFNQLGYGHPEKVYQRAFAVLLKQNNHSFQEQKYYPVKFNGEIVGRGFLDFDVEEKVIVELKKNGLFSGKNIDQVLEYLKSTQRKLAILINFTPNGVRIKRLVNFEALKQNSE